MKSVKSFLFCLIALGASALSASSSLNQLGWSWFQYPWVYSSTTNSWAYLLPTNQGIWMRDAADGWSLQAHQQFAEPYNPNLRPKIATLVDREIFIEGRLIGQTFTLKQVENGNAVLWRVLGSGVPVISEKLLPVTAANDYQVSFSNGERDNFILTIRDGGEFKMYLNGIRIYTSIR